MRPNRKREQPQAALGATARVARTENVTQEFLRHRETSEARKGGCHAPSHSGVRHPASARPHGPAFELRAAALPTLDTAPERGFLGQSVLYSDPVIARPMKMGVRIMKLTTQ
jgi:hypothetical protein